MSGDCRVCGIYTTGDICAPCQAREPYTQAETQAKAKAEAEAQVSSPLASPTPKPGCISVDGPELWRLLDAYKQGLLEPVDVELGSLPPHAGPVMRGIAEHMRLLMGLRRAVGDDRPLPYARSMAVDAGLARDLAAASKAIGALVRAGVIEHVGALPPLRPGIDGTKLYAPPTDADQAPDRRES